MSDWIGVWISLLALLKEEKRIKKKTKNNYVKGLTSLEGGHILASSILTSPSGI